MIIMKNKDGIRRAFFVTDEEGAAMVKSGEATATYHSGIIEENPEYMHKEMVPAKKKAVTRKKPAKSD